MVSRKFSVIILVLTGIGLPTSLILLWIYEILPYWIVIGLVSFLMLGIVAFAVKYTLPLGGQSSSLYELMALSCERGNYNQAIEFFSNEVRKRRRNKKALFNLGSAYLNKGDFDKCIEICNILLESTPNDATVLYNLARAYRLKGKYDDAIKIFAQILKGGLPRNFPMRDFEFWTVFAELHIQKDDLHKALVCVDKALELRPNFREALDLSHEIRSKFDR